MKTLFFEHDRRDDRLADTMRKCADALFGYTCSLDAVKTGSMYSVRTSSGFTGTLTHNALLEHIRQNRIIYCSVRDGDRYVDLSK